MRDDAPTALAFRKMHGLGNDFVVLDRRGARGGAVPAALARAMGDRRRGVGFDQMAVIGDDAEADAALTFLNADGSEAGACGNATRCVARLLMDEGGRSAVTIRTARGLLACEDAGQSADSSSGTKDGPGAEGGLGWAGGTFAIDGRTASGDVRVNMGAPLLDWRDVPLAEAADTLALPLPGGPVACSMGNPHCTFVVEDAEAADLAALGRFETHPLFPERANVQAASVRGGPHPRAGVGARRGRHPRLGLLGLRRRGGLRAAGADGAPRGRGPRRRRAGHRLARGRGVDDGPHGLRLRRDLEARVTVAISTHGCRLNAVESQAIAEMAEAAGLSDAVIVNTCAVTAEAVRKARRDVRRLRRENPGARVIVTGCAAQIEPETFAAMAEVDLVLGNEAKTRATTWDALAGGFGTERVRVDDIASARETAGHLIAGFGARARAHVQIQNGCDHRCTFCVIPYGRGPARSVPAGVVVEQIARLAGTGYREVVLTGVDLTSWGADLPGRPRLGDLVRRILRLVPDLPRLRLSSIDSVEADPALMEALGGEPRLMPHLHLSLQAGHDLTLKRMRRRHLRDDAIAFLRGGPAAAPRPRDRRRSDRGLPHGERGDVRGHAAAGGGVRADLAARVPLLRAPRHPGRADAAGGGPRDPRARRPPARPRRGARGGLRGLAVGARARCADRVAPHGPDGGLRRGPPRRRPPRGRDRARARHGGPRRGPDRRLTPAMHPNPAFRQAPEAESLAFARERGFGTLTINGSREPLLAHIPFLLDAQARVARLHLVRSNPVARALPARGVIAVTGPDGYVSPDWYGVPDQVPTWNYVAVHLVGPLERLPQEEMRAEIDALSEAFEARLAKPPWRTSKMTPEALDRMMRQIVPCRMAVEEARGTWKLSQNKPEPARLGAADGLEASGVGAEAQALASLMRAVVDPTG